jgi:predicted NUDIX family NTP pyrophosphohydrolase
MKKKSAGIIFYRYHHNALEIFLVHPGGPYWAKKDNGVWSIPKGEFEEYENPLVAAKREVEEETGIKVSGNLLELNPVKQKGGKTIYAWAQGRNIETGEIKSNTFDLEWPPKSGEKKAFPEIDKAAWFTIGEVEKKIIAGQVPLIEELKTKLDAII